jgi:predicted kinase
MAAPKSSRASSASRAARPPVAKAKAPTKSRAKATAQKPPAKPKPRLIIIGGWPGTGKTTIATHVCKALNAAHVRVDSAEHALRTTLGKDFDLKALPYRVAYAIAEDNLRNGLTVVADSINPWGVTRSAWLRVASRCDVPAVEVEIICSDVETHQKRLANAKVDEAGVKPPTWEEVMQRHYEPWSRDRLVIDTAEQSAEESAAQLLAALSKV